MVSSVRGVRAFASSIVTRATLLATLIVSVALPAPQAEAQEVFRFYPETGHYVDGDYLVWYLQHGGPEVIGLPRTEDYRDINRLVQYFRNIRLEWDCGFDGKAACRLRPGNLGEDILNKRVDLPPGTESPGVLAGGVRSFSEVNKVVQGDFLAFYDLMGGADFFGFPMTQQVIEAGQTVQWFQRARMQRDADGVVRLSPLGDYWIDTLKRVPAITAMALQPPVSAQSAPLTPVVPRIVAPVSPPRSVDPNRAATPVPGYVPLNPVSVFTGKVVYRAAEGAITLARAGGGTERILTSGDEPAFSPDGNQVAFTRWGEQAGLWLYDLATGEERRISTDYQARSPVWSPDGTRLAYVKAKQDPVRGTIPGTRRSGWRLDDHYSIGTVDIASNHVIDIPSIVNSAFPTWSPDGKQLIFDSNMGLYVVPSDGSGEPIPVPDTYRTASFPAWSPDGQNIAVMFEKQDNYDIGLLKPGGGPIELITSSPYGKRQANNVAPTWSPDGQYVAFLSDRDGTWRIYVVNIADKSVQPLLTSELGITFEYAEDRSFSWSR